MAAIGADVTPVRLLDGYISEKTVRCAFCRQRQSHKRGYFVELDTGMIALAGHCCALKIGGQESIKRISRSVDQKKRTADIVRERDAFAAAIEQLSSFVSEVLLSFDQQITATKQRSFAQRTTEDLRSLVKALDEGAGGCRQDYHHQKDRLLKKWPIWLATAERLQAILVEEHTKLPNDVKATCLLEKRVENLGFEKT